MRPEPIIYPCNNGLEASDIIGNQRYHTRYWGYSKSEAVAAFIEEHSALYVSAGYQDISPTSPNYDLNVSRGI